MASSLNKLHEEQKSLNEDRLSGKDNNPAIRQDSLISELEEEVMKDIQKIDSLSNKIDTKQIDDDIKSHLNEAKRLTDIYKNIQIIYGHWENEAVQRNYALNKLFIENYDTTSQ